MQLADHREFPTQAYAARLTAHLRECSRAYPRAWRLIDMYRDKREELGAWPSWCFCPLAASYAIVCDQHQVDDLSRHSRFTGDPRDDMRSPSLDIGRVGGLAAWRASQGIYAIDSTVLAAVAETPVNGAIPVDVLLALPQWCVYVATPGMMVLGIPVSGFFAFIEHDANTGMTELRMLIDEQDQPPYYGLHVEVIHLNPGQTLQESYERMLAEAEKQAIRVGVDSLDYRAALSKLRELGGARLAPILSALFYLCSQTAEYREAGSTAFAKPTLPAPTKIKGGWRLFPPDRPKVWHVGERLGRAIREAMADGEHATASGRAGPRPHVRRAHWHGFWSGPRAGVRKFQLRWLPPIAVALADDTPEAKMRHEKLKPIRDLDSEIAQVANELEARHAGPGHD